MKKTLIMLIVGVCSLCMGVSFAAADLSKELSTLTEQILAKSARPFTQLEELKKLFSHCAEEHTDPVLKTACQSWLDKSYPAIKEFVPQQVFIELGADDVEVKKIGEIQILAQTIGMGKQNLDHVLYEVNIPKYHFRYQFPVLANAIGLDKWRWEQEGAIAIPHPDLRNTYARIYLYQVSADQDDLITLGKKYRQIYDLVFSLKDSSKYFAEELGTGRTIHLNDQEKLYFSGNGVVLPSLDLKGSDSFLNNENAIYGIHSDGLGGSYYCSQANLMGVGRDLVRACKDTRNLYWGKFETDRAYVFWNSTIPSYIWALGEQINENYSGIRLGKFVFASS